MKPRPFTLALVLACLLATPVVSLAGQEAPQATMPTTAPATGPASYVAEARTLPGTIELSGVFQPAEKLEVKLDLESFSQPLEIKEVAEHGAAVQKGDVLLAVDPQDVQRGLAAAESRKALADIALNKARTDAELGTQSDALAHRIAQRQLANAEEALSWFESVDGEAMLKNAEMMVTRAEDSIGDQEDELEQLRKMYNSEELTEDTADIVVKRALRQLRQSKEMLDLTKKRAEKVREKDYVDARQALIDALDRQRLENAQLENDMAARKVQREASLIEAEAAAVEANEAYEELKADAGKLTLVAPADGYVFYGQLSGGNWQNAEPDRLEVGEEIKPGETVMTFYQPGTMQIIVDLPESDRLKVEEGSAVTVTPTVMKQTTLKGTVARISPLVEQKGPQRVFEVTIDLPEVPEQIAPGYSAEVKIEGKATAYPMVPADYVRDGQLRVQQGGAIETVEVETGQRDGTLIQITEGIEPGTIVLPPDESAPTTQPND